MGWARAIALAAFTCGTAPAAAAVAARAATTVDTPVSLAPPGARLETSHHGEPRWVMPLSSARLFVEAQPVAVDRGWTRGRGLLVGYRFDTPGALLLFRAGYRYGLPLAEAPVYDDAALLLTSGGSVAVSAGTVARLQLDLDGFREIAGSRIMRLEAVPGLRFRFGERTPWEAGFGMLAGLRPPADAAGFGIERFAGVVQMSGRF